MKRYNNRVMTFGICFLFTLYYVIQAIINKNFLFVIGALVAAFIVFHCIYNTKFFNLNSNAYRSAIEMEVNTYVFAGIILWILYQYPFSGHNLVALLEYKKEIVCIIFMIVSDILIEFFINNIIVTLHVRLIVHILLIVLFLNKIPVLSNYFTYGMLLITGITYLVGMARVFIRDKENFNISCKQLHFTSWTFMIMLYVVQVLSPKYVAILVNDPFDIIHVDIPFMLLIFLIAVSKICGAAENILYVAFGGKLLHVCLYLFLLYQEKISSSVVGLVAACFLADWICEWLIEWKVVKGWSEIVVSYIITIPLSVFIWKILTQGNIWVTGALIISIAVLGVVKHWEMHKKHQGIWIFLLFLPYMLMVATQYEKLKGKCYFISILTAIVICMYIKISNKCNIDVALTKKQKVAKHVILCIGIIIPLLVASKNVYDSKVESGIILTEEQVPYSFGNEIYVYFEGDDFTEVHLEWSNGEVEVYEDTASVTTTIKSNILTAHGINNKGQEATCRKIFFTWKPGD